MPKIHISQTLQKHFGNYRMLEYSHPIENYRKEVFTMSNNDQEFLVQKIRTQYTEKQHTELDTLKALDAKVKRPANVFA